MQQSTLPLEPQTTLEGVIERCVYQNSQTSFGVFVLALQQAKGPGRQPKYATITGVLPGVTVGNELRLTGLWKTHKKFGDQFEVTHCAQLVPKTIQGLKRYLGSGMIKGIGPSYAEKLVDTFGTQVLTIIDQEPERLLQIPGIGQKRYEQILQSWAEHKGIAEVMVFLQDKGISPTYATKIYRQYGAATMRIIQEDPYRLADDIWGIGFKMADQIAQQVGVPNNAPQRICAGTLFSIGQAVKQGHLYLPKTKLLEEVLLLLQLQEPTLAEQALESLASHNKIIRLLEPEGELIGLQSSYFSEQQVANSIRSLLALPTCFRWDTTIVTEAFTQEPILNNDQIKGIESALQQKVTIITGGPGTGKTTLIRQLLRILDQHELRYKLAAPTGRAAQRITEGTGHTATTIHRLLEFDMQAMAFQHNERNKISADFIIVDEASMLDIFLAQSLLRAVASTTHLVLIGDIDQLPSVGAGNFLQDCIQSGVVPTTRLTHIFRQAHNSLIIINAHRINQGEFPVTSADGAQKDFVFIREEDPDKFTLHAEKIIRQELPARGFDPWNCMMLCPMNRGSTGTQVLNVFLQQLFNSQQTEMITLGTVTYKVGDKVMQIRNNYDKHVFNGDIGILQRIDRADQSCTVLFDGRSVSYAFDEMNELILAYSITIHKSQGSEYPVVIIPLFTQHFPLLQRNLVYTALTRAKRLCYIIGQTKALAIALNNAKSQTRLTRLQKLLTT